MCTEQTQFWMMIFTALAAVGACAAAWLMRGSLRAQRKAEGLQWAVRLADLFGAPAMIGARSGGAASESHARTSPGEAVNHRAGAHVRLTRVVNLFEVAGLLMDKKEVDERVVWTLLGYHARFYWQILLEHLIKVERKSNKLKFRGFESLMKVCEKIDKAEGSDVDYEDFEVQSAFLVAEGKLERFSSK